MQLLNCPKYPLLRDILGNLRATFLQSWVILAFFCVLGVVGHRGFTIVLTHRPVEGPQTDHYPDSNPPPNQNVGPHLPTASSPGSPAYDRGIAGETPENPVDSLCPAISPYRTERANTYYFGVLV